MWIFEVHTKEYIFDRTEQMDGQSIFFLFKQTIP